MEVLTLPPRARNLIPFIKGLRDATLVILDPSGYWEQVVPHEEGVLIKKPHCSTWFVNGFDTIEQVNGYRVELNEPRKNNPIVPPAKWPDCNFKHWSAFIDNSSRLNGEIRIDFDWRQLWGHPYGALFELEDQSLALVLHRNHK